MGVVDELLMHVYRDDIFVWIFLRNVDRLDQYQDPHTAHVDDAFDGLYSMQYHMAFHTFRMLATRARFNVYAPLESIAYAVYSHIGNA